MKQLTNLIALSFLTIGLCSCENEPVNIEELIVEIPIEEKLPQVFINTNGAEIVDEPKINASIALAILCFSLILLWYHLPKLFDRKNKAQTIMSITGILSLIITLFLASGIHDIIIRIAGVFGVAALLISFIELYKADYYKLLIFGIICLLLFLTNYYIYETEILIDKLPLIQKVTFLSFCNWFVLLSICIYRKLS